MPDRMPAEIRNRPSSQPGARHAWRDPGGLRSLGEFLRSMRESLALTQDQLAARTLALRRPVSRTTISALEQGKHSPTAATVVAISKVLHIEPMEVIDRLELAAGSCTIRAPFGAARLDERLHECFANEEFQEALEILDVLCEDARHDSALDPDARVRRLVDLTTRRALALERLGALVAAKATAERALSLAADHPELQAEAYLILAETHLRLGNLPLAVDTAQRAVERSTRSSAKVHVRAWLQQGRALRDAGLHEDARQAFVAGRDCALAADDAVLSIECEGSVGVCLLELGRVREAHTKVLQCVERARRHNMPVREARWLVELGRIAFVDGRSADAQRHADGALRLARNGEEWPIVFGATLLRHRIARRADPTDPDRRRVAYLKKILGWVGDHADHRDLREFRREVSS